MLCNFCGHEDNNSLVNHIQEEHETGIQEYLAIFPGAKVVSAQYWGILINAFVSDEFLTEITDLKPGDRRLILDTSWERQRSRVMTQ